jgi:hypothetical protein
MNPETSRLVQVVLVFLLCQESWCNVCTNNAASAERQQGVHRDQRPSRARPGSRCSSADKNVTPEICHTQQRVGHLQRFLDISKSPYNCL